MERFANALHECSIYRVRSCPTDGYADVYVYPPCLIHFLQAIFGQRSSERSVFATFLYFYGYFLERTCGICRSLRIHDCLPCGKKRYPFFQTIFRLVGMGRVIRFCAVWFLCIYLEGGTAYLNNLLFHQTINRAIDSFDHKKAFWYYGITFWYSVAPWSILYVATIIIAIKKKLLTTDKEKLFLSTIVSTFVLLSMFSAKLDIYMLPLFPFFTYLTILLLPKIKGKWLTFPYIFP